jgi:hypothetical protein
MLAACCASDLLVAVLAIVASACGSDDSPETKTVTRRFLRAGLEAGTPGSGGFIEIPQRVVQPGPQDSGKERLI